MKASTSNHIEIKYVVRFCVVVCILLIAADSVVLGRSKLSFEAIQIEDNAEHWWARALGDINNDGVLDLVLQNNNAHGGWLGWYEAKKNGKSWTRHIIASNAPKGGTFACGDMAVGDIDNDGDIDILGFEHPGEWDKSGAPTRIYWFENPSWKSHYIGQGPDFLKDVDLADFNRDKKLDLVAITYDENKFVVFRQDSMSAWTKVQDFKITNLHEGMHVGDIDGDGDLDVATNGYWVENPGADLTGKWTVRSIDSKWHNQTGDWSKNATKVFCRDITGDGRVEVFISHSERKNYPVSWYESPDPKSGSWTEHVVADELVAAHTLQVFDMDKDGDYDVLAGVNRDRAKGLKVNYWPVLVYLNQGNNLVWKKHLILDGGIYNGQVADLEGDGDFDVFRLPTHSAKVFEVLINQLR